MAKRKINKKFLISGFIFFLGLVIALYPVVSRLYYRVEANNQVQGFEAEKRNIDNTEVLRRIALEEGYNLTLDPTKIGDPYTEKEQKGVAEYARMLELQEKIGHVEIPKIGEDLPIYAGTSEAILQKGAGHLEGTSLPIGGENTHTVITAHRSLPTAKLFADLDKLKLGDKFFIHNIQTVLAYEVVEIMVVEPWDFEPVLVVEGKDYATLLTCTPFMINSHRLLVRGERIDYTPAIQEDEIAINKQSNMYKTLFFITLGILVLVLIIVGVRKYRNRKKKD